MNIIILKWVLTNFTLLEVVQPDVTQTTVEMLQSDWAATIVAAKTNPDIGLKPYLPSGTVGLRPTTLAIGSCKSEKRVAAINLELNFWHRSFLTTIMVDHYPLFEFACGKIN